MSRLRRRIAERLVESQHNAAILTTFNEVDMQPVIALRRRHKDGFESRHGVRLGFMSFFAKAAVQALRRFPVVNARIEGGDIIYHDYCDIGVAVGSPRGLVVPILRNVEAMSFAEIESRIAEFGAKARDGTLSIDDMSGGTFTISNGGVFGSLLSTPILNPPQSGILGICTRPRIRPVAVSGEGGGASDDVRRPVLRPPHHRRPRSGAVPRLREGSHRGPREAAARRLIGDFEPARAMAAHASSVRGAASPGEEFMDNFDVVVIGAGPGGYVAAIRAAQLGLATACVDAWLDPRGKAGTRRHVPERRVHPVEGASRFVAPLPQPPPPAAGPRIEAGDVKLDLRKMLARKDKVVRTLTRGVAGLLRKNKVESIAGLATLKGGGRIEVAPHGSGDGRTLTARHIVLATGSVPVRIPVAEVDGDRIVDNEGALAFSEVPQRLGIIGRRGSSAWSSAACGDGSAPR